MFTPGCGCCGCNACPYCSSPCLKITLEGFAHDTDNCNECTYLDDTTFVVKRPTGCPTVSLSVADATGTGAVLTYTVEKQPDGSCTVTAIALGKECLDPGSSKSSDEKSGLGGYGTGVFTDSENKWPCGDGKWTTTDYGASTCKDIGDAQGGSGYSAPTLASASPTGIQCSPATAKFTVETAQPAGRYKLTSATGSGAIVRVAGYTESTWTDENKAWAISGLSAVSSGTGYAEGQTATLSPSRPNVVTLAAATATVSAVARYAPSLSVSAESGLGVNYPGQASVQPFTDTDGRQSFRVVSVQPTEGLPVCGFSDTSVKLPTTASLSVPGFSGTVDIVYLDEPEISVALDVDGCAIGFDVAVQGSFYITDGRPTALTLTSGGAYRIEGAITAVELIDGGEYWPNGSHCGYTSCEMCAVCPYLDDPGDLDPREGLLASFSVGSASNTVTVWRRSYYTYGTAPRGRYYDHIILSATQSSVDENGERLDCGKFKFETESITKGCTTNGTITVSSVECDEESEAYCETKADPPIPEQITLKLSGMGQLFLWASGSGGAPGMSSCPDPDDPEGFLPYEPLCGQCDTGYDIFIRGAGAAFGPSRYSGALVLQDFEIVLDRDERDDCYWSWSGMAPAPPTEVGGGGNLVGVSCGGDLNQPVNVSIGPVGLNTDVQISPPTKQAGEAATAEVTGIGEGGAIDEVTLTFSGSGYAVEIFERQEPTVTATVPSTSGTGAVLAVTLTQQADAEGNKYWDVTKVTVTDGGDGYTGTEYVSFEAADGDTVEYPASARIVVERQSPTLSAAASGGSGAVLSVSLSQAVDFNGEKIWSVSSVGVTSGGDDYTDGSEVTFTVDDGAAVYGASATVNVGRVEPTVTASVPAPSAGTGAVLAVTLTASGTSWTVSGLTITSGGSGYEEWDYIQLATGDTEESGGYAYVTGVNGSGSITAVTIYSGGSYYQSTGVIQSVTVSDGGQYFKSTGEIQSVVIEWGGAYYRVVGTGEVDADEPLVSFRSYIGTDATATATIDTNLASATFGQITGITITNGGQGYRLSGTGYAVSISLGNAIGHLEWLLGNETPPEPNEDEALDCANFWDKNLPIENRVSLEPCPSELLDRDYIMVLGNFSLPHGLPYGEGLENATWCYTPPEYSWAAGTARFFEFGNGPITCTISPA